MVHSAAVIKANFQLQHMLVKRQLRRRHLVLSILFSNDSHQRTQLLWFHPICFHEAAFKLVSLKVILYQSPS
jgi:hypothetical protein